MMPNTSPSKEDFSRIVDGFPNYHIVVIGDVMLDEYIFGDVHRISPEAPVPVLHISSKEFRLGGAANAAHNIVSLGGRCTLVGQVGKDDIKMELLRELDHKKIKYHFIERDNVLTTKKTRIIARNQQVVRLDHELHSKLPDECIPGIVDFINTARPDLILVSDYDKGFITESLMLELKKLGCRIVADPKVKNSHLFKDVFAITPNMKEAQEISGKDELEEIGRYITELFNTHLILTRSKDGVSCFNKETKEHQHFPAQCGEVIDVSGAGDTFAGAFALAIASGVNLMQSVVLANTSAGIAVGKLGTAVVSQEELKKVLMKLY